MNKLNFFGFLLLLFACESDRIFFPSQVRKANFTFDKLVSSKRILGQEDILNQLKSKKDSPQKFKLKRVTVNSESEKFIKITGIGSHFQIEALSAVSFKARIILERSGYDDSVLIGCEFELHSRSFDFKKFGKAFSVGGIISTAELLAGFRGAKSEKFTLKNIAISGLDFAKVIGKKPNLQIEILKPWKFEATIILEKENHFDSEIKNCKFEIGRGVAPVLGFEKFVKYFNPAAPYILKDDILGRIRGFGKTGYELKEITLPADFGRVSGGEAEFAN